MKTKIHIYKSTSHYEDGTTADWSMCHDTNSGRIINMVSKETFAKLSNTVQCKKCLKATNQSRAAKLAGDIMTGKMGLVDAIRSM